MVTQVEFISHTNPLDFFVINWMEERIKATSFLWGEIKRKFSERDAHGGSSVSFSISTVYTAC